MTRTRSKRSDSEEPNAKINRRAYVAALSAASAGLLAGCSSGGDGDDGGDGGDGGGGDRGDGSDGGGSDGGDGGMELGERVPTVRSFYWAGLGDTTEIMSATAPIIKRNLEEHLGIRYEIQPKEAFTIWDETSTDQRNQHLDYGGYANTPGTLNPVNLLDQFRIEGAGPNSVSTQTQYANCDVTMWHEQLKSASSQEELREITYRIQRQISKDIAVIPFFNRPVWGAYRNDQVQMPDVGVAGVQDTNPEPILQAIRADGYDGPFSMNVDTTVVQTTNPTLIGNSAAKYIWDHYFYSPLIRYDENWEIIPVFATDWESENDFQTVTFELREGHTAHNGDPIGAEDVKFTFEYLNDNSAVIPNAQSWPYTSIDVVDETSVTFNFERPNAAWLTSAPPLWGILPKSHWEETGAPDNPGEFNPPVDEIVGTGPYEIAQMSRGQFIRAEPFDGHWRTPEVPFEFQRFQDQQSMARAFRQGSLNVFIGIAPSIAEDLQGLDEATVSTTQGFATYNFYPQWPSAPQKFREFRMAVSQALDRRQMVDVGTFGSAHPILYASRSSIEHPFTPPEYEGMTRIAETERSNPEAARQALADEGWGWDDEGRLHYPADADLSPLWPKGESPRNYPEKWPCVEELGLTPTG